MVKYALQIETRFMFVKCGFDLCLQNAVSIWFCNVRTVCFFGVRGFRIRLQNAIEDFKSGMFIFFLKFLRACDILIIAKNILMRA